MNRFQLIEGKFTKEEAKNILTNIFSEKINFHVMKNFSSQERFGKDDSNATIRIGQLKKELERLQELLLQKEFESGLLSIHSEIIISATDK